ncbi:hypothetical protein LCGC14_1800240 [marine sediment metagenome]|uniref:Uncharacterized protein n=1 Tax=marine sediment metagenome TaxID=412755 RepID=A0A0F9J4N7_9ZZZZ
MVKAKIKLNENEQKVLEVLSEVGHSDFYVAFDYIGDYASLSYKEVRVAARSLRKKGLAEYMRGLMTDDSEVAGSGYAITADGRDFISEGD